MSDAYIEIDGLVRRFGPFTAVDRLSFTVSKGEVLGFLGPNGAGKSTTMKMITGFLAPTEGHVRVCGFNVETERLSAQRAIGYLPEGAPAYGDMTPRQFLSFIAEVRGLRGADAARAVDAAVEKTELDHVLDQQIETLSKGFTRRVGLAQAILHDPPVLIMDEPTDGLDPNQKHAVRGLIKSMAPEKAIIISTHILEEVDSVCSRTMIIDRGRVVVDGTPEEVMARSRYHNAVTVVVAADDADAVQKALESLAGISYVVENPDDARDDVVKMTAFPSGSGALLVEGVAKLLSMGSWDVRGLYAEAGRLDEVFRSLTTLDTQEDDEEGGETPPPPAKPDIEDVMEASFE